MCSFASLFLLAEIGSIMTLIGVILVVAIGLGAVIFVHELGHFLVAKACGVKCEKFMIGFDIGGYKLSRKWGETEYGIGILPLGGYVKMLGQDDDPAHIAEQLKQSEVNAASPDAVEVHGPNGETYHVDRRSYLAKSVPQRMAIISAGVVMNIIFAFIFATVAYGIGVKYMPSIVSETIPGSPAWRAGLESGDEIVKLGDQENPTFTQLKGGVTLGDLENGIPVVVQRANGKELSLRLTPEQAEGRGLATIGIRPPYSLTFDDNLPAMPGSPAAMARQIEPPTDEKTDKPVGLKSGDEIVRVNNEPVADFRSLMAVMARSTSEPLQVTVRRNETTTQSDKQPTAEELTFEVAPRPLPTLGLVMKMGPIVAVQANSPAAKAGLKAGDLITAVDGQPLDDAKLPTDWQADTFTAKAEQAALAGATLRLSIERDSKPLEVSVKPQVPTQYHSQLPTDTPEGVPALGIAYRVGNEVVAVIPGSPAAAAEIKPGDIVTSAEFVKPKDIDSTLLGDSEPILLSDKAANWPMIFSVLQWSPAGTSIKLTVQRGDEQITKTLEPATAEGLFVADRGFFFNPIERVRRATSVGEQIRYGWDETTEALGMVFRFLKKIGTQVPVTMLGGPITIAKAAGMSAYNGLAAFLIFLTMLSANLAVLNFLPIPLLDGGHMAFLAYEGVRGRPASEKFVVALHTIGFVFIVSLMLFVVALDLDLIQRKL
jgi:regulator of sigma E protease